MLMRLPVSVPVVRVSLFSGLLVRTPAKLDRVVQELLGTEMRCGAYAVAFDFHGAILQYFNFYLIAIH